MLFLLLLAPFFGHLLNNTSTEFLLSMNSKQVCIAWIFGWRHGQGPNAMVILSAMAIEVHFEVPICPTSSILRVQQPSNKLTLLE